MPLTVASILNQPVEMTFDWEEQAVKLTYNAAWFTGPVEDELEQLRVAQAAAVPYVAATLAHLLIAWDVMDGRKPYPTTLEALGKLSLAFLVSLRDAIFEDMAVIRQARAKG